METVVGSFAIAGATLAQIINDFGSVEGDCDGILFGCVQRQTTSNILDDEVGPVSTQELITARVTGYYCSGRVQSFYDATGKLNHSKLSNIVKERQSTGEDPPIGWFIGRRNSTLWPSMREVAVTSSLQSGLRASILSEDESGADASVIFPSEMKALQIGSVQEDVSPGTPKTGRRLSSGGTSDISSSSGKQGGGAGPASRVYSNPLSGVDSPVSPSRRSSITASPRTDVTTAEPEVGRRAQLSPCIFVLFTESDSLDNAVRTHEYRAFQSRANPEGVTFEPLPVKIVNAGVSYRGFYEAFAPVASIPWFDSSMTSETGMRGSSTTSRGERSASGKSAAALGNTAGKSSSRGRASQASPDASVMGFAENKSVDVNGGLRVQQVESLYQKMLSNLERLSKEAHESSLALN